jgi:hypothetical protein
MWTLITSYSLIPQIDDRVGRATTTSAASDSERSDPRNALRDRRAAECGNLLYGSKYRWRSPWNMLAIQERHSERQMWYSLYGDGFLLSL